jgi:outer membrane receptor protein involved in Fe transport
VPLNPFGAGASSAAARDYVTDTAMQDTELTQHVLALTLRGDLLELWAGPLSFATGIEYRKDEVSSVIDAISAANDFHTSPGGGIVGSQADLDVTEGFLELALPIAREQAFAHRAELNGAIRVTEYSNSGTVETWKVGVEWEPVDWLRFRGTRSRDIRAPNLFELYGAPQSSFQTVDDPANGGVRNLIPTLLGGNTTLQPEEADTWTVGGVLTAGFGSAGALRLSLDRFDIEVDGVISTLGAQAIVVRCFQGDAALCQYVTRGTNNLLTQILNPQLNLQSLVTRGWDFEADYTLPLAALGVDNGDSLGFRVLATFLSDFITGDGVNRAGQNGAGVSQASGLPDYTINGYITYRGDPLSAQIQIRHIADGVFQATNVGPGQDGYNPLLNNSVSHNHVGSFTYVNFNAGYTLWSDGGRRAELFGVVNNLLNRDPPNNIPSSFGPTNNVLYDVIGRYYRAGARFSF